MNLDKQIDKAFRLYMKQTFKTTVRRYKNKGNRWYCRYMHDGNLCNKFAAFKAGYMEGLHHDD